MLDLQTKLATDNDCFNYLMQIRWNGKPQCVYCNHNKVCTVKNGDFKCSKFNKRFTIKTNTIFQGSKLSLQKWLMAIYFVTNDKKGVSSIQLADNIGVTQKTAWSMLQKLKYLLVNVEKSKGELNGTTEIDEAYIGGKEGNMRKNKKVNAEKAVIIGMVNRDTKQVKAFKIISAEKENLLPKINIHNARGSMIVTDTLQAYNHLKGNYNHKTVKHSAGEYVRVEKDGFKTHTNSIEGFWSLVKRTINGTHHWVSKKHINKYLAEMSFRYSNKSLSVAERFEAICLSSNLNITYKQIIA
jgi:transposase-like protein